MDRLEYSVVIPVYNSVQSLENMADRINAIFTEINASFEIVFVDDNSPNPENTKSFELITTAYQEKREELQQSKNIIDGLHKQIADLQETISKLNARIEQDALNRNEKAVAFSRNAGFPHHRYRVYV